MAGLSMKTFTDAVASGEHDLARGIQHAAQQAGHPFAPIMKNILNRLPGGMHVGDKILGHTVPNSPFTALHPGQMPAPSPAAMPIMTRNGVAACGQLSAWDNNEPFPLVGFKSLAAGAQTQGTDLIDFHAAASNPTWITTDDLIPGNISVYEMNLFISPRLTVTLGFEGVGFLNSAWIIEYINGIEKARWSIRQLGAVIGATGLVTSGAATGFQQLDMPGIPWRRSYDPNVKAKTALQISVTTTTVSALDASMVELGSRP